MSSDMSPSTPPPPSDGFTYQPAKVDGWFSSPIKVIAAALVALVVIGGVVAWYVLRPDNRSTAEIERQIKTWADDNTEGGGSISVQCPDPVQWNVGGSFHCIVTQDDQSVSVTVSMENDQGDVTWRVG